VGAEAWVLLAALVPLAYVVLATHDPARSTWVEPIWPRLVYYPVFFLALAAGGWRRWTLPGPDPVH
jgi:hypothetical protein